MGFRSVLLFIILVIHGSAMGAVSVNATCEWAPQKNISGDNINNSFVIASLSKIFTSQWSIEKIGPFFQYETIIHIQKNLDDSFNVHIQGDGDPTWGREMLHFFVSELDKIGIQKIRKLSFDEKFFLSWRSKAKVIDNVDHYYDFTDLAGAETYIPTPEDVRESLLLHFLPRSDEYNLSLENAKLAGIDMPMSLQIQTPKKIVFLERAKFSKSGSKTISIRSLPLYQIIKLMNITSNNYLADMLYYQLGGESQFRDYLAKSALAPHETVINLKNGSGFPIETNDTKFYNQASCASILTSLSTLHTTLKQYQLGLESVFPVANSDKSTLDKYELPTDTMVAKTGTVKPTIALAGMVLAQEGPLFFSQLVKTESSKDWPEARQLIKNYVLKLIDMSTTPLQYQNTSATFWGAGNL
jgi:serine-type D-Ala-D-Ala carboxypeptidase/endopeptidase (penicillin-binding protein 4)